jgi:hypothetical protein
VAIAEAKEIVVFGAGKSQQTKGAGMANSTRQLPTGYQTAIGKQTV